MQCILVESSSLTSLVQFSVEVIAVIQIVFERPQCAKKLSLLCVDFLRSTHVFYIGVTIMTSLVSATF